MATVKLCDTSMLGTRNSRSNSQLKSRDAANDLPNRSAVCSLISAGLDTGLESNPSLDTKPTVSIGLPVYNGENFLAEAIESVLAQTFQDYELILSDNASTDRTAEICRHYASQDRRVRYYRSPAHHSPTWNYNRVFSLAKGSYFKWAAHDDIFEPTFIEKTLALLIQNPAAVLSFSGVDVIDEEAKTILPYDVVLATNSHSPSCRFQEMISLKHRCYDIFGLIKTDVLAQTPLIEAYAGSDRTLLARLSLLGSFETVPEPLFKARKHAKQSIAMLRNPRHKHLRLHDYAAWFDPDNKGKIIFPNWRIFEEYLRAIRAVSLSKKDRLMCYFVVTRWIFSNQNWAKLGRDLAIALLQIFSRLRSPLSEDSKTHQPSLHLGHLPAVHVKEKASR
ncbi:MAG: glycosyltransferase family 2 protein [Phormidesmis priestleyi]|uniref:Glycosyltransferase family 2 protein n=1 Tax=Phormidesmis priestleyi TaxID=268141 RepID=A0A2W4XJ01_9CYAN|nr:MAG: glycosyltransferase family 2 protein [Phormidesmis priestleyi]